MLLLDIRATPKPCSWLLETSVYSDIMSLSTVSTSYTTDIFSTHRTAHVGFEPLEPCQEHCYARARVFVAEQPCPCMSGTLGVQLGAGVHWCFAVGVAHLMRASAIALAH